MRKSQAMLDEEAFVEKELGDSVICSRCSAKLNTYATVCTADLSDPCPGFMAIEEARAKAVVAARRKA